MNGSMSEVRVPGTQGLSKRNVIIQKDEYGFGLTVSGDNPVYVQSVKPGSAAAKAGVQVGDQIIKVNGTLVTQSNHIEVVTLIKSGSYVALTLLGKDNSKSPTEHRSNRLSGGHLRSKSLGNGNNWNTVHGGAGNPSNESTNQRHPPLQSIPSNDNNINIIQNERAVDLERTLNQEREYSKTILEKYRRAPSPKTQLKLAESKTRISALENQLHVLQGIHSAKTPSSTNRHSQPLGDRPPSQPQATQHSSLSSRLTPQSSFSHVDHADRSGETQQKYLVSNSTPNLGLSINQKRQKVDSNDVSLETTMKSNKTMEPKPIAEEPAAAVDPFNFDQMFAAQAHHMEPEDFGDEQIISMEDDEFSDEESLDHHGPFMSMELLKDKKAHLAVFLHYLLSNSDPNPLFFWVVTEIYSKEMKTEMKDWKKWAYEIYSTFVAPSAPLKVNVGGDIEEKNIAEAINDPRTSEERLRDIFSVARERLQPDLEEMLTDFRMKRSLGLGGLFGDRQLEDTLDRAVELKIIETTLTPHLDELLGDHDSSHDIQGDQNIARASAIATLMKSAGLVKMSTIKGPSSLEKCRSFGEREKSSFNLLRVGGVRGQGRGKGHSHLGHQFLGVQYSSVTLCNVCNGLLWGIGIQGLQCTACDLNIHQPQRRNCMNGVKEHCTAGKKLKAPKPPKQEGPEEPATLDTPDRKPRAHSQGFLEERPPTGTDQDEGQESEKESADSRAGTPHEDQPTPPTPTSTPTPSTKRPGRHKTDKVPAKHVSRSNSDKYTGNQPKTWKYGRANTNGATPPYGERVDSPIDSSEVEMSDSDGVDNEMPVWSQTVADKKLIKKLKSKEIKRQEVIHELLHTEKTHVRKLKILDRVFYKKIKKSNLLTPEEIENIFPNLDDLIEIHVSLLKKLKLREKESEVIESIGDIMLERFSDKAGDHVKESCATFCRNQKSALEAMKGYQQNRKDFAALIAKCEENPYCRRLHFADILACTHHRLVKYPLLLEQLNKATAQGHVDFKNVEQCAKCCKTILNHVNDEIKRVEDEIRLKELSKRIEDRRTIHMKEDEDGSKELIDNVDNQKGGESKVKEKFNILNHKFVCEGDLTWNKKNDKKQELHVILLHDFLLLLIQQDEKYIIKNQNAGGAESKSQSQSPIISLSNALIREVATDKKAFFLITTQTSQIYELVANTMTDKKSWVEKINNSIENYKGREHGLRGRRDGLRDSTTSSSTPVTTPTPPPVTPTRMSEPEEEKPNEKTKEEDLLSDEDITPIAENEKFSEPFEDGPTDEEEKLLTASITNERLEELNGKLDENNEQIRKVLSDRSSIFTELHGESYMEQSTSTSITVVSAMEEVNRLNEIFENITTTDDQKDTISRSISGLHQNLLLLQAALTNSSNRHDSYTDSCDGGMIMHESKRTSSTMMYSSDMSDSLPRHSPLSDAILSTSPPPILVSDTPDQNAGLSESPKKMEDLSTAVMSPADPAKIDASNLRNGTPPKLEPGLLITSPFKIQSLRKRTSDPSFQDSGLKLHSQTFPRASSFTAPPTHHTESSDSES